MNNRFYDEKPLVLLVMPPVNNTTKIEAKELLYTSICQPLSEAGYYVIPPFAAMEVFKNESAYDAEMFLDSPLGVFKDYFGADAVIFSQIDEWEKILAGIHIKVSYLVKSTKTNEVLFERSCDLVVDMTVNSSGSILGMVMEMAAATLEAALTDEIVAARIANEAVSPTCLWVSIIRDICKISTIKQKQKTSSQQFIDRDYFFFRLSNNSGC